MSFASSWSNSPDVTSTFSKQSIPTDTGALEFLFLAVTCRVRVCRFTQLSPVSEPPGHESLGIGAVSMVQKKKYEGRLVAVKQCRVASRQFPTDEGSFNRYLKYLTQELHILTQYLLREHPNIIKVLAFGYENFQQPFAFLVLEYSDLGPLDAFLRSRPAIPLSSLTSLCLGVANGLVALHSLNICHGDIKAANTLIFEAKNGNGYNAKLCDFSQAIITDPDDIDSRVYCSYGTPLLNAPEIRTGLAFRDKAFNIQSAKRTDIFSYGLLVWQVLRKGENYFDDAHWLPCGFDTEEMEAYLNALPKDGLCKAALEYVRESVFLNSSAKDWFHVLFAGTLRDDPSERQEISVLLDMLGNSVTQSDIKLYSGVDELSSMVQGARPGGAFPSDFSLLKLLDTALLQEFFVSEIPMGLQMRIVCELEALAHDPDPSQSVTKAAAAMLLSECHVIGFGGKSDVQAMLAWLSEAAEGPINMARMWLPRLHMTFGSVLSTSAIMSDHYNTESQLSKLPNNLYFSNRIRQYARSAKEAVFVKRAAFESERNSHASRGRGACSSIESQQFLDLEAFAEGEVDHLGYLHWAAWLGNTHLVVSALREGNAVNEVTPQGRTPLFYACLAGDLAMLKLLLHHGGSASMGDAKGITPLHLCIMFEELDSRSAVQLLLQHEAKIDVSLENQVCWQAHDLDLVETPIVWAVQTRNAQLVKHFVDAGSDISGLDIAIDSYFAEIVDLLMSHGARSVDLSPAHSIHTISRPFRHWLCHGKERLLCISDTMDVLEKHGVDIKSVRHHDSVSLDSLTLLESTVMAALIEEDVEISQQLMQRGISVKERNDFGSTLGYAISRPSGIPIFAELIELLAKHYSSEELNAANSQGMTYLFHAVTSNSITAARILLENGADANCPSFTFFPQSLQVTPTQACFSSDSSLEMLQLLIAFGGDVKASLLPLSRLPDSSTEPDPLMQYLIGKHLNTSLLDTILDQDISKNEIRKALEFCMIAPIDISLRSQQEHFIEVFRYLLCHEKIRPHINELDDYQVGLVDFATLRLNPEILTLLIDAGAQLNVIAREGKLVSGPLHVALMKGRLVWQIYITEPETEEPINRKERLAAMEVATLLLVEHNKSQSEWFKGITRLHLATYMGILDEVKELIRDGDDANACGEWPTNKDIITAKQLLVGSRTRGYPYFLDHEDEGSEVNSAIAEYNYDEELLDLLQQSALDESQVLSARTEERSRNSPVSAVKVLRNSYRIFQALDSH